MKKKEVQSFLGFTNFYQQFIKDFSKHAHPLFDFTWNDSKWHWGTDKQSAFDKLKRNVTSALVLILLDLTKPFHIKADSSDFTTRAVLSQISSEDEKWHPVAFFSKSLSLVEWNYEIHDKEMLAITQSLQEWRHFIEGAKHQCEIWMDHKNLKYFMIAKQLNQRQAQWSLHLTRFNFLLHHKSSKSMGKLDALSWWADHRTSSDDNSNITLLAPKLFAVQALEGLEMPGLNWTSCKISTKAWSTLMRNPSPRLCNNFASQRPALSDRPSSQNEMAFSTFKATYMSCPHQTFANASSSFAMTIKSPDMQAGSKHSNSPHGTTSGWTCLSTSANMSLN